MPTVKQIADILPDYASIILFAGWEQIAYQRGGTDEQMYGRCLVTYLTTGSRAGSYELDIMRTGSQPAPHQGDITSQLVISDF